MKIKCIGAILVCLVIFSCTACYGTGKPKPTSPAENTTPAVTVTSADTITETAPSKVDLNSITVPKPRKMVQFTLEQLGKEERELYRAYISERVNSILENNNSSEWITPPQFRLISESYVFCDVDNNGSNEMIQGGTVVNSMYGIKDGAVQEIDVSPFMDPDFRWDSPVLLNNGVLRATYGFGYLPSYQYAVIVDGRRGLTDELEPPNDNVNYSPSSTYNHKHFYKSLITKDSPYGQWINEIITEEEFHRRVKLLDGDAVPVKLETKNFLDFAQKYNISVNWLDKPTNSFVPMAAPKAFPRHGKVQAKYEEIIKRELEDYQKHLDWFNSGKKYYYQAEPAKLYYAFHDLDGNGDRELFFGEEQENGDIWLKSLYFWLSEESEAPSEHTFSWFDKGLYGSLREIRVLSNGYIAAEYGVEGSTENSLLRYNKFVKKSRDYGELYGGVKEVWEMSDIVLWRCGDEAAFIDWSERNKQPVSLTKKAYDRQRSEIEKGAKTVELEWKPLENFGK